MAIPQERCEKLKKVFEMNGGREIYVISQVDPDALAATEATAAFSEKIKPNNKKMKFYYCGGVGRKQNKVIMEYFGLDIKYSHITEYVPEAGDRLIYVDSHKKDGRFAHILEDIEPVIIIDHHQITDGEDLTESENQFILIEKAGSTATLIYELMLNEIFSLDFTLDKYRLLPLLLALAVQIDTNGMKSTSERDWAAYQFFLSMIDIKELNSLSQVRVQREGLELLTFALNNRDERGSRLVAYMGHINESEVDHLGRIAEIIMEHEPFSVVAVWGILDYEWIEIRFRSIDFPGLDRFIKTRFGKDRGGGRVLGDGRGQGGAKIPVQDSTWKPKPGIQRRNG